MAQFTDIPYELRGTADVAGNGEFFWLAESAADAARWIAGEDLAITGGEIYRRHSPGWATYLSQWLTQQEPGEPWPAFVNRALERALAALETDENLFYFFATATRP